MGFCFYNNVLVGVTHAQARLGGSLPDPDPGPNPRPRLSPTPNQARHGVGRVAILDFDIHHGNGDSDITEVDPSSVQ